MAQITKRSNPGLARWIRAGAVAVATWLATAALHANPSWLPLVVGVLAGVLALVNTEVGVLVTLLAICVPIVAINPIVGICVAVVCFAAEHYLGGASAERFFLIALALAGAVFGPAWAAIGLAGYLLGPAEGALAAIAACISVELYGLAVGRPSLGAVFTGGSFTAGAPHQHLLDFALSPATLLSAEWISPAFKLFSSASVDVLFGTFAHVGSPLALVIQPVIWALGAVAAGTIMRRAGVKPPLWVPIASVSAGVGIAALGDAVMRLGLGLPYAGGTWALALAASLLVALAWAVARETFFAVIEAPVEVATPTRPVSIAAEDADVDELLRLISTAEDKLASQHTSQRVVLITDMKSFSRMTEEDGSVASAKAIQRHRDLLVPIISANRGCGKSTGGDGVVAAFESAADAIRAAVGGQRALADHNAARSNERELVVRMGLAFGEVVLDNGGRPFIGAGLNLAARVMNLADGGQIFATGDVTAAAEEAGAVAVPLGEFALKNIANPMSVAEVLWYDGQQPRGPQLADGAE